MAETDALNRLRRALLADRQVHAALAAETHWPTFLVKVLDYAQTAGIAVDAEMLAATARPDPLGLSRLHGNPPSDDLPPPGWLPAKLVSAGGIASIDWAYAGDAPLNNPFYEGDMRWALGLPLTTLVRLRTRLEDLPAAAERLPEVALRGLVFHMSRCGSTLVAQMLAADPANLVISEAEPLDSVLRLDLAARPELHDRLARAMIKVLTHRRTPAQRHAFLKLDCWHALLLPLFRRLFPDVPWIFLYREPLEVMASQLAARGLQTQPEILPPAMFGLSEEDAWPSDHYCAKLLGRTCAAVEAPLAQGGGLLVNYAELPGAFFTRVLPHFGIAPDAAALAAMRETAAMDAKMPGLPYQSKLEFLLQAVDDDTREVTAREIGPVYRRLEALRAAER